MQGPARKRDEALAGARYLREPRPLPFPSAEIVPETKRHMMLRTALFSMIAIELKGKAAIGSDQLVYWNARGRIEGWRPTCSSACGWRISCSIRGRPESMGRPTSPWRS